MANTKIVIGTDGGQLVAVFTEIKVVCGDTPNEAFLCFSDVDGFSNCTKDWMIEELRPEGNSRESMFMLGALHQAGFKNVEIVSYGQFIA